jgi:hypothetical protein
MDEYGSNRQYYICKPRERGLYRIREYELTIQKCKLSIIYLYILYVQVYSMLVILPRLKCTQVETGLSCKATPVHPSSYPTVFI